MYGFREGFQEHWAAHFARQMAERLRAALATRDEAARRAALSDALGLGREARLRLESGRPDDACERAALAHLHDALDEAQAALNAYDVQYDQLIRDAGDHAERAASELARVAQASGHYC